MPYEDRDMCRRRLCDPGGRDESDAAASQGTPWVDSHHWKLGRGKEGFFPTQGKFQREHSLANTDFRLLASRIGKKNIFL